MILESIISISCDIYILIFLALITIFTFKIYILAYKVVRFIIISLLNE